MTSFKNRILGDATGELSWGNWTIVTEGDRTFPIPTVNTAEQSIASYIELVGKGQNNYAGVGPYAYGSNPYTYLLKGAGTEEDPYIIETDIQLARAIATGGMNLYDKLYYKLGCDIDLVPAAVLIEYPAEALLTARIRPGRVEVVDSMLHGIEHLALSLRVVDLRALLGEPHTAESQLRELVPVFVFSVFHRSTCFLVSFHYPDIRSYVLV